MSDWYSADRKEIEKAPCPLCGKRHDVSYYSTSECSDPAALRSALAAVKSQLAARDEELYYRKEEIDAFLKMPAGKWVRRAQIAEAEVQRLEAALIDQAKLYSGLSKPEDRARAEKAEAKVRRLEAALKDIQNLGDPTQGKYCGACGQTEHDDPLHLDWCPAERALKGGG